MAVFYKLYQDNRSNAKNKGHWFARTVMTSTTTIDDLADIMQNNCTLKRADILAVISELVEVMTTELQNSHKVKIDRLGSFKIGVSSKGSPTVKEFNVTNNIKDLHVLFQPEVKIDSNRNRVRSFVSGCNIQELPKNTVVEEEETDGQ
ncbi:MAG: HU family DNA-binding protein [Prevotella sp.]|nr:HU family DNA-binding protein [Prevotella sp.]